MSWVEGLDLGGADLSTPGAIAYARGAIISAAARAGASTYSVVSALQANGIGYRYVNVRDTLNQAKAALATNVTSAALPFDSSTGALLPSTPPPGWTGTYFHQVTATYRTRDQAGNYQLNYRTLGIRSTEALTPAQAISDALGIVEQPIDEEEPNTPVMAGDLLTLQLTGAWYDVRPGIGGL